jgi:hypothetical protein
MRVRWLLALSLVVGLLPGMVSLSNGQGEPAPQEEAVGQTPPRLAFSQGQVSFWRVGAPEWVQAQINTPLAPGDQLYTGSPGNMEIQIGGRAFVRGWAKTQIGLESQEPDFLQFKVSTGSAAFDLRTLDPGRTVEVSTPNAAFTIEHAGYYRVEVSGDRTSFITRRSGRATVTSANGAAVLATASEEVVVEGIENPRIASYAAPPLDDWDKWNYARTDALLDAMSARYVTPGTYGVDDLDHHGSWRVVENYGPVWVPAGMPADWAPYTTGSWVHDPYYGWSWVDTAPWGWAPYHHGRWVHVNGFWGWAPGPVLARPIYAPALVAFLGAPGLTVGVGGPLVGWVALGWGEPCVPWWGRPGFAHRPWWGGWGGPRVVNNVVIQRTTVVKVEEIHVYRNSGVRHGVVVVDQGRFGHGRVGPSRIAQVEVDRLRPVHTGPQISPSPRSLVPTERRGIRPPEESERRPVIATRRPPYRTESEPRAEPREDRGRGAAGLPGAEQGRVRAPGPEREPAPALPRPPFGQSTVERSAPRATARPQPPVPQARPEAPARIEPKAAAPAVTPEAARPPASEPPKSKAAGPTPGVPGAGKPEAVQVPAPTRPAEPPRAAERGLPGQPANRLAPNRGEARGAGQRQPQGPQERAAPPAARTRETGQTPAERGRPQEGSGSSSERSRDRGGDGGSRNR